MDFGFNADQEMLRATARKFLENECTSEFVRARMAEDAGFTPEFWTKLAEQGWLGLVYPEAYGGAGLGFVDLTVLMEEMGRAVMPGPFFSTLLGGLAILEAGSDAQKKEWITKVAEGEARVTLAWTEPSARWDAAGITTAAKASAGGFTLGHQAVRPRRARRRGARGGCAHARGQERGRRREPLPGAQGHEGPGGEAAADDGPDAQALRGEAERRQRARGRAARSEGRRMGAAGPRPRARHRRALRGDVRGRAEGPRHDHGIREDPHRVRQADRLVPGREAQGGRHARGRRERQVADLLRGMGGGRERPRGGAGGVDGEGVHLGRVPQGVRRRHPAARRHRLHLGARPAPLFQAREVLGGDLR